MKIVLPRKISSTSQHHFYIDRMVIVFYVIPLDYNLKGTATRLRTKSAVCGVLVVICVMELSDYILEVPTTVNHKNMPWTVSFTLFSPHTAWFTGLICLVLLHFYCIYSIAFVSQWNTWRIDQIKTGVLAFHKAFNLSNRFIIIATCITSRGGGKLWKYLIFEVLLPIDRM